MKRQLLVEFNNLFKGPAQPIADYLSGISRLDRLQCVSHLLGYLSHTPAPKRDYVTDMQQFFGPQHNALFASQVYQQTQALARRVESKLNFLHPKTVLQLYSLCFELPDEPTRQTEPELECSLFVACLVLNESYIREQSQAMTVARQLLPTQPLAAAALAGTFSDFELVNHRLHHIAMLQLIKSVRLFEFLEAEARFAPLLQAFLRRFDCQRWQDYFRQLSGVIKPVTQAETLGRIAVEVPVRPDYVTACTFLRHFTLPEGQPLDMADFTSLRATPLCEESPGTFVLVYPVLVLEALHKGLYFQFSLANRTLPKAEREKDWRSVYCDLFSEQYLMYLLLDAILQGRGLALSGRAIFEGWQLKGQAEPDYYFRHDNRAVLFESKDVLVHKDAKAGHDFATYLDEVRKKFYEDENHHPKAAKQLAGNVARLLRHQLPFDTDFDPAELLLYPVLVVHDRLYNQPGLNVVVNDWFQEELAELAQQGLPVHNVRPLIIIDVDTLLAYHEDFRDGRLVFEDMLEEYVAYLRAPAWAGMSAAEDEQRQMQRIHPFALFLENYAEKRDMLGIPSEMLYQILPIINRDADDQPGQ
ncbi:hypothetical protein GO988_22525 [Hymenobacter sp. HMF4947]|uniref:Uncharacterized protein n=1 Tax=Hymenobacter ginkgonis TaxID=2682976 RepID=A0A7K1TL84_9BACT|nr:hypothetical protein [Hymenobacter ginkgonis]MVN79116.1 hypothetical protein [Hymenobacter ginkgonis]